MLLQTILEEFSHFYHIVILTSLISLSRVLGRHESEWNTYPNHERQNDASNYWQKVKKKKVYITRQFIVRGTGEKKN